MREKYFDNAATTPLDPRVLAEMRPFLEDDFGNSESIHGPGRRAASAVEAARARVAAAIHAADPEQVIFTSGATESCNWVIRNFERGAISPFEHSAVREAGLARGYDTLANDGLEVLPPEGVAPEGPALAYELVCQMLVNNEMGAVWPAERPWYGDAVMVDATQALGKTRLDLADVDYAAFSAHKVCGPKGIGALYLGSVLREPSQRGGGHEFGLRAGTLNVPAIVGFGVACAIAEHEQDQDAELARELRSIVLAELESVGDWQVNGGHNAVPHILSLSFLGIEGETLVIEADARGYAISSGAACSSASTDPSHVLTALGMPAEWLRGTVRISFGRFNTTESAWDLAKTLRSIVNSLRTMN
jgi:cysteine desulfurase